MTVDIVIDEYARPQLIAPKGRWTFYLRGVEFEVWPRDYMPAYNRKAAVRDAKKLAKKLGFECVPSVSE